MKWEPEDVARGMRVVNSIARKHKGIVVEGPCGVWDSQDIGFILRMPKKIKDKRYDMKASFALPYADRHDEAKIAARAQTAIDALHGFILVSVKERRTRAAA